MQRDLVELTGPDQVLVDEPMSRHTTFKIGGPADYLVLCRTREEIRNIIQYCDRNRVPWMVIGQGSNLLVLDGGIRGVVIKLGEGFAHASVSGTSIRALAGTRLGDIANLAQAAGLAGLEFAEGIPGSVGGAVFMNAGAYGGEMKDVVEKVTSLVPESGREVERKGEDLAFSYRHSCFQENGEIILEVSLTLVPGVAEEIRGLMNDYAQRRREKQPLEYASAGSSFKRPPGVYVGPLLEELGLKGLSIGGAEVSAKHAGFIINRGGATAKDVLDIIEQVKDKAYRERGVILEPEIRIVGQP